MRLGARNTLKNYMIVLLFIVIPTTVLSGIVAIMRVVRDPAPIDGGTGKNRPRQLPTPRSKSPVIASADSRQTVRPTPPELIGKIATGDRADDNAPDFTSSNLSSKLEELLLQWDRESSKIESVLGTHTRSEFNHRLGVEQISNGWFLLESRGKGRIDFHGVTPKEVDVSSKSQAKTEIPYSLESGVSERWVFTGEEVIMIDDIEKTYKTVDHQATNQGSGITADLFLFLSGLKMDDARRRFSFAMATPKDEDKFVWLLAVPQKETDRRVYQRVTILLDTKTYVPIVVNFYKTGGLETRYKFKGVSVNDPRFSAKAREFCEGDPYTPRLRGYTRVSQ